MQATIFILPSKWAGLDLLESAGDPLLLSVLYEAATLGKGRDLNPMRTTSKTFMSKKQNAF